MPWPLSVAIVCDNASFRMGGEAAIPLRFFKEFRRIGVQVTLLTHERVKQELAETLTVDELADVVFFADGPLQKATFAVGRVLPSRLQEHFVFGIIGTLTERRQVKHLARMEMDSQVDVVFQPVPISPKAISLIRMRKTPVFFGPLNGAMDVPPAFRSRSGSISDLLVSAGRAMSEPLHRVFPAKAHAAGVFLSNPRTLNTLPKVMKGVPKYRSFDATVDSEKWRMISRGGEVETGHFLYVGRLVDWKAVDIAVRAVHSLDGRARLTIVGDGPERASLERLAASGPGRVEFLGFQPHSRIIELYRYVTAQLLPSLREAGGNVCMEALAAGVPMIATRWGGAVDVIRDGVDGILVSPECEVELIGGFAKAMVDLMDDPRRAIDMGAAGRRRVLDAFSWQTKARDYLAIFEQAVRTPPSPSAIGILGDAHPATVHLNCAWSGERV